LSAGKNTEHDIVIRYKKGEFESFPLELIGEEPLLIRINSKPYSVIMRTPGEEIFHAAGFCLGEGIVDSPDDFASIGYCKDDDPNVIDIYIKDKRQEKVHDILDRKSFVSQTSCGICGKEMVKDIYQILTPSENKFTIKVDNIYDCINKLSENQNYYKTTRGSHAALILDDKLDKISFAEDVGRHNALDKAIGKAFMNKKLGKASVLVLSSRISYELIQKAARAHLPIMISHSRPTFLAVKMGKALNMTLVCPGKGSQLLICSSKDRII
jgi:FdhD protein